MNSMTEKRDLDAELIISANFIRALSEKKLSEPTLQMILAIIKDKSTQEREQHYLIRSNITDILNSSKTEQEIIEKLDETFPK